MVNSKEVVKTRKIGSGYMKVEINKKWLFTRDNMTLHVSEKDIPFATSYTVINPKSGNSMIFDFIKSTGAEFDPETIWIYKSSDDEITMKVYNERVKTVIGAGHYLRAKLNS